MGGYGCNDRQLITNGYAIDRPLGPARLLSISRFTGYEREDYCYYYGRTTCVARETAFTRAGRAGRSKEEILFFLVQ